MQLILSGRTEDNQSLDVVKEEFTGGLVAKDEYASALCSYQKIQNEMKSDARNKAEEFYQRRGYLKK